MERKFGDKLKLKKNKYFTLMMMMYLVQRRNTNNDELASPIVLRGFPKSLRINSHILFQLGYDHSLSNTILFISQ